MIAHLYAGGYGDSIQHFLLNTAAPSLRPLRTYPVDRPSWLALSGRLLWAATEREEGGVISGFSVRKDGALIPLGALEVPGSALCHLAPMPGGYIAGANYGAGSLFTVSTAPDGRPDWLTALIRHSGSGPNPARQEAPHVHSCVMHPDGKRLFSADMGLDRIFCYGVSPDGGLTPQPEWDVPFPPGAGPRHLVFADGGRTLFAAAELGNRVFAFREGAQGWTQTDCCALTGDPDSLTAAIRLSADERRLYVTVRGEDTVTAFAAEVDTGRLTRLATVPSGGHWPRDLILLPDGSGLLTANERSGCIALLPLDGEGVPGEAVLTVPCGQVTSLVTVEAEKKSGS